MILIILISFKLKACSNHISLSCVKNALILTEVITHIYI